MADQIDIEAAKGGVKSSESSLPAELVEKRRIRYIDDEIFEALPPLQRTKSVLSVHSMTSARSGRRSIDPSIALPIQYRTLSYNIEDGKATNVKASKSKNVEDFSDAQWHILSEAEICKKLVIDTGFGLSDAQITISRAEHGNNVPSKPSSRIFQKWFWYFFGGFGAILLTGGILVMISYKPLGHPPAKANLALAIVLFIVFIIQALFNAWQDFSSSRVMKSITGMLPEDCHVLRNGVQQTIPAVEIVPGDVLFFKAGSKLPADIRFSTEISGDAKFDRSILSGESAPLAAVAESTDANYLETRNIGFAGTHCVSGSGVGIVVATGDKTVFGHIAKLTSTEQNSRSPLQKEIIRFVLLIVTLMITMNLVVLGVWAGYIRNNHPGYMPPAALIVNIVSVGIAFVPEGLPIALTASLTITANIMRKNNILCKSLKTVETLGAVSVLLSDKTGTLTKNQMTVTKIAIGTQQLISDEAVKQKDDNTVATAAIQQLRIVAAINNAGEFDPTTMRLPLAQRKVIADATDAAVLRFSESIGPVSQARQLWRKRFDLPFNSKNKFTMRVHGVNNAEAVEKTLSMTEALTFDRITDLLLTIKGAPDVLLPQCTSYVSDNGEPVVLDDATRQSIESVKDTWSAEGKRVLLLARKVLPRSSLIYNVAEGAFEEEALRHASTGLTLVGLLGIIDPPREEIPSVVAKLRGAGIRVMMVTGDFKLTAQAIARACGILDVDDSRIDSVSALPHVVNSSKESVNSNTARHAIVLSGSELISLNDVQWSTLVTYRSIVFARTTPDQKLRIVKEFKARSNIVAMTGDGVNDAPSLKEADIGIAPGSASDIALEAADMVLLDSFSAIIEALRYGRAVFDNLRKLIAYLLPAGTFSEFWPVMTSVVFGLPQILSSFLMIIICCFTDCAAAIALAFEKPEADVLLRPPRDVKRDRLVDWRLILQSYGFVGVIECTASFAMSYWYLQRNGVPFSALWFSYGDYSKVPNLTSDEITARLNIASSIYFVNLVVMQWFNIMALRTRRLSIFQHPPIGKRETRNLYILPALLFALVIAFIFCYVPGVQRTIDSAKVPVEHWFLPMAFGLGLLCLDELRKCVVRRSPKSILARIAW